MECRLLLLADYANVAGRNKLNVMGIFGQVYATQFPTVHPEMFVVAVLAASPSEYNTKRKILIKLIDEDATQEFMAYSQEVEIPKPETPGAVEINIVLKVVNTVFPKPGRYQVSVLVDQDEKRTTPLVVTQLTQEQFTQFAQEGI